LIPNKVLSKGKNASAKKPFSSALLMIASKLIVFVMPFKVTAPVKVAF
jgi:hypothetical protein